MTNTLVLFYLKMSWFSPPTFLKYIFARYKILCWWFLSISWSTVFCPPWFLMRNLLSLDLVFLLLVRFHFSYAAFKICFFFVFSFQRFWISLGSIRFRIGFTQLPQFVVLFAKLKKFAVIVSLSSLSALASVSSPSRID